MRGLSRPQVRVRNSAERQYRRRGNPVNWRAQLARVDVVVHDRISLRLVTAPWSPPNRAPGSSAQSADPGRSCRRIRCALATGSPCRRPGSPSCPNDRRRYAGYRGNRRDRTGCRSGRPGPSGSSRRWCWRNRPSWCHCRCKPGRSAPGFPPGPKLRSEPAGAVQSRLLRRRRQRARSPEEVVDIVARSHAAAAREWRGVAFRYAADGATQARRRSTGRQRHHCCVARRRTGGSGVICCADSTEPGQRVFVTQVDDGEVMGPGRPRPTMATLLSHRRAHIGVGSVDPRPAQILRILGADERNGVSCSPCATR